MSDAEVAFELTKLVLQKDELSLVNAEKKQEHILSLYAKCLATVRDGCCPKEAQTPRAWRWRTPCQCHAFHRSS